MRKDNFRALTGIRALAAFSVYFHHYPIQSSFNLLDRLQKEMHIGVTIFFVLSGFLIAYRYADNSIFSLKWIKKYLISRIARIYPLYLVVLVLTLSLPPQPDNVSTIQLWLLNLSLFKGFFQDTLFSGISQSWTLAVEACFYLSAPLIFIMCKKFRSSFKVMILLVLCFSLCSLLFTFLNYGDLRLPSKFYLSYTYGGRFLEFFAGIIAAMTVLKGHKLSSLKLPILQLVGIVGTGLCLYALTRCQVGHYKLGIFLPMGITINNVVLPLFVAVMLLGLVQEETLLKRFLSTSLMQILGKSSYAFYLIHMGVIRMLLVSIGLEDKLMLFIILNLISVLLYKVIEEPATYFFKTKLKL